jgi:hypothetical protein
MALNSSDVLRLTLCGTVFTEQACNVFFYLINIGSGSPTLEDVLEGFRTVVLPSILDIQSQDVEYDTAEADNLTNGIDFGTDPLYAGITGNVSGEALPPYAAWAFTLERASKLTRNGAKRFAGVPESAQQDGVVTAGFNPTLVTAATAIGTSFAYSNAQGAFSAFPLIVGVDTTGQRDLSRVQIPTGAVANAVVSTQNTRKFGRGS